ncbi:hypothetical protein LOZ39_003013 [Ophidiomyces ophidiicola]|uniref:uncharacterized protein n=1 Tax=Ophidiomyces ophidiicola TaxID=1387563 RepID=UPI0020C443BC|nr:uncharacterized protein LOZ57_002496 [Ophidiomyces ophidiicola]KAI1915149.1 hypothetical protein LOZ61_001824 [Ophidiomyces ophidiicola]KAI1929981.1 hypothetical protein LOZ60_001238 [Ophidiomyces ophidiicola]KAI1949128.1 hypothetical protein LOZ57_002496 [Ophidiomyces ophidiicola]KAI2010728.1 hypothetical protein LOZ49_003359 [Ophidiomyces ophidiicola]KAI2054133.1 hypothetical protein LOZ43_004082 [Ophidiomyces ophidiicola]
MPKADQAAKSTRIRDNQRRSRARRKEYLEDLERRLRRFEKLGVEATQEVQAAGRKAAEENALLRSLLKIRSVTDGEIDAYLQEHRGATSSIAALASSKSVPSKSELLETAGHPACGVGSGSGQRRSPLLMPRSGIGRAQSTTATTMLIKRVEGLPSRPLPLPHPGLSLAPLVADVQPTNPKDWSSTPSMHEIRLGSPTGPGAGQLTPCETAAGIITRMRGDPDLQNARAELGCSSESTCMVKNLAIFDLLDR